MQAADRPSAWGWASEEAEPLMLPPAALGLLSQVRMEHQPLALYCTALYSTACHAQWQAATVLALGCIPSTDAASVSMLFALARPFAVLIWGQC